MASIAELINAQNRFGSTQTPLRDEYGNEIEQEKPQIGGFTNAVARGVDQLQMSLWGFTRALGDTFGIDALTKFSDKGIRANLLEIAKNPAEIKSWDDVDSLSDFGTYVLEALGEQVPQLAIDIPLVLASGGTAAVGKNLVGKLGTTAYMNFKKAAPALLTANLYAQSAGETQVELLQAGQYDEGATALLTGIPKAMLDKFGYEAMLGATKLATFGKGVGSSAFQATPEKIIAKIGSDRFKETAAAIGLPAEKVAGLAIGAASALKNGGVGAKALTGAMSGMTMEGLTEGVQTALDEMAVAATSPNKDFFSAETLSNIQEGAIRGAVAGGVISGAGAGIAEYIDQKQKAEDQFDQDLSVLSRVVVHPPQVSGFRTESGDPLPSVTPPPMEQRVQRPPVDAGISDTDLVTAIPPTPQASVIGPGQAPESLPLDRVMSTPPPDAGLTDRDVMGATPLNWDTMTRGQLVTLYRGESADNNANGEWWTTDKAKAEKYGNVSSVTLPAEVIGMHAARGHHGNDEFVFSSKRPGDLAQQPTVTGQENIMPESRAQVAAQVSALLDPATTTDTVFVAQGQDMAPIQAQLAGREDVAVVPSDTGTVITTDPEVAAQAAQGYSSADTGAALGYPFSKEQVIEHAAQTGQDPVNVAVRDEQGTTVFDALAPNDPAAIEQTAQALQQKASGPTTVEVVSPQEGIERRTAEVEAETNLPTGWTDARLKRGIYRGHLQGLADELVAGGDVQYVRDENDRIVHRTASINPSWFKDLEGGDRMSVEQTRQAVAKALAGGKKLGARQARMVSRMLDVIGGERADYARIRRAELEELRAVRRAAKAEQSQLGETYTEESYDPEATYSDRVVQDMASQALEAGASIKEVYGIIGTADFQFIVEELNKLIRGASNAGQQTNAYANARSETGSEPGGDNSGVGRVAEEPTQEAGTTAKALKVKNKTGKHTLVNYDLSEGEQRLAAEIIQEANLTGDIFLMQAAPSWAKKPPAKALQVMTDTQIREVERLMKEGATAVYVALPRNQHMILMNRTVVDIDQRTFALAHELGHIAVMNNYTRAPVAVRQRLEKAFRKEQESNERYKGSQGFDEWMADKIAITYLRKLGVRLTKQDLEQLGVKPTQSFFASTVDSLRGVFSAAKSRILTAEDETAFARKRPTRPLFDNDGLEGDARFYTMSFLNRPNSAAASSFAQGQQFWKTGRGQKFARMFITGDGELRSMGDVGRIVADIFYEPFGKASKNDRYFSSLEVAKGPWVDALAKLETKYTEEEWRQAFEILSKEISDPAATTNNPRVIEAVADTRELLETFYRRFLHRASPLIGHVKNYFPRYYEAEAIADRRDEFVAALGNHGIDTTSAENVAQVLGETNGLVDFEMSAGPSGRLLQERVFKNPALIQELVVRGFLNTNPVETLRRYLMNGIQRGVFEQIVGGYRLAAGSQTLSTLQRALRNVSGNQSFAEQMQEITSWETTNKQAALEVVKRHGFKNLDDAVAAKAATRHSTAVTVVDPVGQNSVEIFVNHYEVYDPNKKLTQTYKDGMEAAYTEIFSVLMNTVRGANARNLVEHFRDTTARTEGSGAKALEFLFDNNYLRYDDKTGKVRFVASLQDSTFDANGVFVQLPTQTQVDTEIPLNFADENRHWVLPHEVTRMKTIINGYFGKIGLDMNPKLQKAQNIAMMLTNWLVLSLSTVSSITELGMFARITKDMAGVKMLKDTIKEYAMNRQAMMQMYETLGVVERHATLHALSDAYNLQNTSKIAQRGNDLLFKLNLQQGFTNMVRTIAAHFASKFLEHHYTLAAAGDAKSLNYLTEVGISDINTLQRWIQAGKPILSVDHMSDQPSQTETDLFTVAGAIHRIIDTAVMRPNKAERPMWMNDPKWALFAHLKSYSYSFYYAVLKPLYQNTRSDLRGGNYGLASARLLGFMIPMFAMAALSNELREEIQYAAGGEYRPSDNMDFGKYLAHLAQNRIGMTGVPDMWLSMLLNKHDATLGVFAMSPVLSKADQVLLQDENMTDRILHLTPFVAQNPGLQRYLSR